MLLVENQLTKIPIRNHQDPLFLPGNGKHILIGKAVRIIAGDGSNIVTQVLKIRNEAEISALVQKLHTGVTGALPLGGLGVTSSPVTIALA
jgi:hypothetical protein